MSEAFEQTDIPASSDDCPAGSGSIEAAKQPAETPAETKPATPLILVRHLVNGQ